MNEFEVSQSTDNRLTISLIVMTAAMLLELFSRHFYDIYQGGAMMELLAQVVKTDSFLTVMSIITLCAQVYITGCLWRAFRSKGHWAQWACLVMMMAPVAIMVLSWTTDEETVMQNMENPDISSQQIISAAIGLAEIIAIFSLCVFLIRKCGGRLRQYGLALLTCLLVNYVTSYGILFFHSASTLSGILYNLLGFLLTLIPFVYQRRTMRAAHDLR